MKIAVVSPGSRLADRKTTAVLIGNFDDELHRGAPIFKVSGTLVSGGKDDPKGVMLIR